MGLYLSNNTRKCCPDKSNISSQQIFIWPASFLDSWYCQVMPANNRYLHTVDIYKKIASTSGDKSFVLSPISMSAALAMTSAGARGRTSSQMRKVLHLDSLPSSCSVHEGFRLLLGLLTDASYGHTLNMANCLFVDQQFRFVGAICTC